MTSHDSKQPEWWRAYERVLDPAYESLIAAEQTAREMYCFNFMDIHGLLHTEDFSRAITRNCRLMPMTKTELEQLAELRLKRQWHVLEQASPPRIEVILDESALHRRVGGPEVLREQLLHLAKLTQLPHITIRVLPLTRQIDYSGDFGLYGFTLIKFGLEIMRSGFYQEYSGSYQSFTELPSEFRRHEILFKYLWYESLSPERSLDLMRDLASRLAAQPL